MSLVIWRDWSEEIDWDSVEYHATEFHNHVRGGVDSPHEVVDLYVDRGYTVFAVAEYPHNYMAWPWTEFSEIDDSYEDRDPKDLGVVSYPAAEWHPNHGNHMTSLFSTIDLSDLDGRYGSNNPHWSIHKTLSADEHHEPEGLSVVPHPPSNEETIQQFALFSHDDGLVGMEMYNGHVSDQREQWDAALDYYSPHRPIWGFGVDDPRDSYEVGDEIDRRRTTLLLHEGDFNVDDQAGTREATVEAFRKGHALAHKRGSWDNETEDGTTFPSVDSIEVNHEDLTITINASDYDSIEWVSSGETVEAGSTISLDSGHVPYVRADLQNDDAVTSTQPWMLHDETTVVSTAGDD